MSEKTLRLFFGLWPDDKAKADLARLSHQVNRSAKGRPVDVRNLHVTLAFLGDVPVNALDSVVECVDTLEFPKFALTLDQLEYWAKPRLTCVTSSTPPDPLMRLHGELSNKLKQQGFRTEKRQYVPHVTLVRKTQALADAVPDAQISWIVDRVELNQSELSRNGASYSALAHWDASPNAGS